MRVVKKPEVRKAEILDAAETLFYTKGYLHTTIIDILESVNIAKGTFYYYFPSKEDVMDAIVMRYIEREVERATAIAENETMTALEKFSALILWRDEGNTEKEKAVEMMQQVPNAQLQQKKMIETINQLSPIMENVAKQGIIEGTFRTEYPREAIEFLLITSLTMFDEGWFDWEPEQMLRKVEAFCQMAELLLGTKEGSFGFVTDVLRKSLLA